jgi:hypothetical protein
MRSARPDPRDFGPPIVVYLGDRELPIGDLGNRVVDTRLVTAIVQRGGPVGAWLAARGLGAADLPLGVLAPEPDEAPIRLDDLPLGDLGWAIADARLLTAILLRGRAVAELLAARGITVEAVEEAFPGAAGAWPG